MLPHWCADVAFVLAALIPFFIATRWKGGGFVTSILLGWGITHFANISCALQIDGDDERTAAVFTGLWMLMGPYFMAIWAAFAVCLLLMSSFLIWIARGRPKTEDFPEAINCDPATNA